MNSDQISTVETPHTHSNMNLEKPEATMADVDRSSTSDQNSHSEKPTTDGEAERAKTTYLPESDDDYVVT